MTRGKWKLFAKNSHVFLVYLKSLKVIFIGGNFPSFFSPHLNTNVCRMHCWFYSPLFFSLTTDDKEEKLEGGWEMCVQKRERKKKLSTLAFSIIDRRIARRNISTSNDFLPCYHWELQHNQLFGVETFSELSCCNFSHKSVWVQHRLQTNLRDLGQRLLCFFHSTKQHFPTNWEVRKVHTVNCIICLWCETLSP